MCVCVIYKQRTSVSSFDTVIYATLSSSLRFLVLLANVHKCCSFENINCCFLQRLCRSLQNYGQHQVIITPPTATINLNRIAARINKIHVLSPRTTNRATSMEFFFLLYICKLLFFFFKFSNSKKY